MQSPKTSSSVAQSAAVASSEAASPSGSPARGGPAGAEGDALLLPPSSPSSVVSSATFTRSPALPQGGAGAAAGGCAFARRVGSLPAVRALLGVYDGAKAYPVVGWALTACEKVALLASAVCRPVAVLCRPPVSCADWCLCKTLDVTEALFPCVSMAPNEVYNGARQRVVDCVCWPPRAAGRCLARVCPGSHMD
ncbi:Lipid storage droplets surface-binding protein 2 [Gryllus bimaculatus]|nr:Lipid storage droplets surface-binding protein 2 [Gryllus bimaculatus]